MEPFLLKYSKVFDVPTSVGKRRILFFNFFHFCSNSDFSFKVPRSNYGREIPFKTLALFNFLSTKFSVEEKFWIVNSQIFVSITLLKYSGLRNVCTQNSTFSFGSFLLKTLETSQPLKSGFIVLQLFLLWLSFNFKNLSSLIPLELFVWAESSLENFFGLCYLVPVNLKAFCPKYSCL